MNITGTDGNDTLTGIIDDDFIDGLAGDDQIFGLAGNDTLLGGPGNDGIYGDDGDELLFGGPGDDVLVGGNGTDVDIQGGIVSEFAISERDGYVIVVGPEGTDAIKEVEAINFGSTNFTTSVPVSDLLTTHPTDVADRIADLYVAYFDRAPDVEGFDFWFQQNSLGSNAAAISEDFARTAEYHATYPDSLTNRAFVEEVYGNLFDRSPDQPGWDFWTNQLDRGSLQRPDFILAVIDGAYAPTSGPEDRAFIDNKHEAALYYTGRLSEQQSEGYDPAITELLNLVTADDRTVAAAENVVDYAFDNPITLTGVIDDQALLDSLWQNA